jgi:RNA recognition motif-containing protein
LESLLNIYVGNLPYATTGQELNEIFSEYGEVKSAKIIMDRDSGRSKGFGFVEMGDTEANKAIEDLNGAEYYGKQLTVNEAREKKPGFGGDGGGSRGGYNRNAGAGGGGNRRSY